MKENGAKFDNNHSVLDRVLSWIVKLAYKNICLCNLRLFARSPHTLTDTGASQSYGIRLTLIILFTNTLARDPQYYDQLHSPPELKPQASPEVVKAFANPGSAKCVSVCT